MRTHNIVLVLLAAVVALVVALGGYQLFQSRAAVERELSLTARSGAQVVSANVEWVMETARQVLRRVDDAIADPEDALPRDAAGNLAEAVASIPGGPQLYVVDAAGQTLMTTDLQYKPADITDREYFLQAKAGEPIGFHPCLSAGRMANRSSRSASGWNGTAVSPVWSSSR